MLPLLSEWVEDSGTVVKRFVLQPACLRFEHETPACQPGSYSYGQAVGCYYKTEKTLSKLIADTINAQELECIIINQIKR